MPTDTARWLCNALELPALLEAPDGKLRANRAARDVLGTVPFDRDAALRRLLQVAIDDQVLDAMAEQARAGTPGAFVPPHGPAGARLLALPDDEDQVRWVVQRGEVAHGTRPSHAVERDQPHPVETPRRFEHADLAAGVSHELSNAMNAIAGWARLARSGQRVEEALEIIERSADSAWTLARHMLSEAAGASDEPAAPLNVSELVEEAARLASPSANAYRVEIRRHVMRNLHVRGVRPQLWSAVWNLVTNALEAMPEGGMLTLAARRDDEGVHIIVADSGPGMDEATRERVFERYFTTKARGSGLGLALVKSAVEALQGEIRLHSKPDEGTRWEIVLPESEAPADAHAAQSGTQPRSSGVFATDAATRARVLVVDDDIGMRELISTALEMRGATVVAAATAEEALTAEGRFDLALIDMLLPDGNGGGLLAQLRGHGMVDASVLVTGVEASKDLPAQARPDAWLRKPFQLEDLFDCVRRVLPGPADETDEAAHS